MSMTDRAFAERDKRLLRGDGDLFPPAKEPESEECNLWAEYYALKRAAQIETLKAEIERMKKERMK